jgi:hypothetical protein
VAGAVGIGLVANRVVPTHVVWTAKFDTVPPGYTVKATQDPAFMARTLINTTCEIADGVERGGMKLECLEPRDAPTVGEMRLEGSSVKSVRAAQVAIVKQVRTLLPTTTVYVRDKFVAGRPTWIRTAPVWLGIVALFLVVFVPPRRMRRRRDPAPDDAAGAPAPVSVSASRAP